MNLRVAAPTSSVPLPFARLAGRPQRPPPQSVAVFRALQLGDMLCAVPALRQLRRAWPQARITLVGLPWAEAFARRFDAYLDDFLAFPGHPGLPEKPYEQAAWPAFREAAAARRFDLAVQLHGDGRRSNLALARIPARRRAGFAPDATRGLFLRYPDEGSEAARLLALARHVSAQYAGEADAAWTEDVQDIPPDDLRLEFPLGPQDEAEWQPFPAVREVLGDAGRRGHICLHAGARDPARRWPVAHFAALGDALAEATGCRIVLTGAPPEQPLVQAIAQRMQRPVVDAAAPVSAGALALLIARSRLLVSNDTGVSHIAAGLQVPSVIVFRASDMARWAPVDRRLHRPVWDAEGVRYDKVLQEAKALLGL